MVLSAYRNPPNTGPWMCCADNLPGDCPNKATVQWRRCADGNTDGSNTVPVMACDTHKPSDEAMALVHQATCTAPPACTCTPITPAAP